MKNLKVTKADLSKPVMEKIVRFEKKRTGRWLKRFLALIIFLTLVALAGLWMAGIEFWNLQTGDLLSLFLEDREIIAQFWQDTLLVVWEELPQRPLFLALIALWGLLIIIFLTRRKRQILRRKSDQLASYQKNRQNKEK